MPRTAARILIADDEPAVRAFVARALAHHGHRVETASDGLEALEAMARQDFDLLITDIVMPGLDGIELALKVSKDYPKTVILMMTGYAAEKQRAYGLESLIHRVISKPFSLKDISRAAATALKERG